jgi:hypothetical protein
MNLKLSYYKNEVLCTHRGNNRGKVSNAKPFFLLALFDLIEDGVIIDNKISFNSDILKETYQNKAISFKRYNPITPFYKPFFHLNSESYYQIKWKANNKPKGAGKTPSAKFLRENVEYASLDDDLWQLLQDKDARNEIKEAIISYFIEPIKELK